MLVHLFAMHGQLPDGSESVQHLALVVEVCEYIRLTMAITAPVPWCAIRAPASKYHDALCCLGARLAQLALEEPSLFRIPDVIRKQAIGQGGGCEAVPRSTDHRCSKTAE
jgi:hypothetical protein